MIKVAAIFLLGMALMSILGRLRPPRRDGRKCARCGAPIIAGSRCRCGSSAGGR